VGAALTHTRCTNTFIEEYIDCLYVDAVLFFLQIEILPVSHKYISGKKVQLKLREINVYLLVITVYIYCTYYWQYTGDTKCKYRLL
jgi:hypothetical protein